MYYPKTVVWEITWKCNANCIHCGSDCISVEKQNQLTTAECLDLINDLDTIGTKKVTLSGGDPLLREDFPILAAAIKSHGMKVAFVTNAIALDDEKIDVIKEISPCAIGISIDAAESWMHDYIRGHKGCYEHAIESIIKLKEKKVEPSVITTVHKLNYYQLPKIRDILEVLNVKAWQIQYADFIGRMHKETMITEAQFCAMANFIYKAKQMYGRKMYVTGADVMGYMNKLSKKISPAWYGCHAGLHALGISSDGAIRGCLSQQLDKYIEGNIRERSLVDIWNDPNSFSYNRHFDITTLGGYCKECKYAMICKGGCTRSATNNSECRCNPYCLYKIEEQGFTDENQSKTIFTKEEIYDLYNPIRTLPDNFYNDFKIIDINNYT